MRQVKLRGLLLYSTPEEVSWPTLCCNYIHLTLASAVLRQILVEFRPMDSCPVWQSTYWTWTIRRWSVSYTRYEKRTSISSLACAGFSLFI